MSEYAQQLIDNAPPLSDERRARITAIFQEVSHNEPNTIAA